MGRKKEVKVIEVVEEVKEEVVVEASSHDNVTVNLTVDPNDPRVNHFVA